MDLIKNMPNYNIAIIGAGVSGLTAAYLLSKSGHTVHVFESSKDLGGHAHTVKTKDDIDLDIGFMVFNERTYPNLCKLLKKLNIKSNPSDMSFSFTNLDKNFSYNGSSFSGLFCSFKSFFNPVFYLFLLDIIKFNKQVKSRDWENLGNISLESFLQTKKFSKMFVNSYLLPLCSAIWSTDASKIMEFPIVFLFNFLINHGLVDLKNRPKWNTIKNGSRSYVNAIEDIVSSINGVFIREAKVDKILLKGNKFTINLKNNNNLNLKDTAYDKIIFANHSPDAFDILEKSKLTDQNKDYLCLKNISYQANKVVLHTDSIVMPENKKVWASWNYIFNGSKKSSVTYYLNNLQFIPDNLNINKKCFFVSINPIQKIDKQKTLIDTSLKHPLFNIKVVDAQKKLREINGNNNIYFCGAYMGYGFHEDGVKSSLEACKLIDPGCEL